MRTRKEEWTNSKNAKRKKTTVKQQNEYSVRIRTQIQ